MNQIAYPPVRRAMRRLKAISANDETRRLAEVFERALSTERTEINAALKRGKAMGEAIGEARGATEANMKAISALIQKGIATTESEARTILGLTQLPAS